MNAIKSANNSKLASQTVLVLGGYGFIGRHIVNQLEKHGATVVIGTRRHRAISHQESSRVESREIVLHKLTSVDDWHRHLKGVDVVVNAVGILRQRANESYEDVHHFAVAALATACAREKIRFVHVSALGLNNPVKSQFLHGKRRGEEAIKASKADWTIVRPSLVDGVDGYGASWLRRIASWPIHFAPNNATGLLAPISVDDLAEAIARITCSKYEDSASRPRVIELGGDQTMDMMSYLGCLAHREPLARIRVPSLFVRLCSHLFDLLHITPLSFAHYELLRFDNYPKENQLYALLGRRARVVGETRIIPTAYGDQTPVRC